MENNSNIKATGLFTRLRLGFLKQLALTGLFPGLLSQKQAQSIKLYKVPVVTEYQSKKKHLEKLLKKDFNSWVDFNRPISHYAFAVEITAHILQGGLVKGQHLIVEPKTDIKAGDNVLAVDIKQNQFLVLEYLSAQIWLAADQKGMLVNIFDTILLGRVVAVV